MRNRNIHTRPDTHTHTHYQTHTQSVTFHITSKKNFDSDQLVFFFLLLSQERKAIVMDVPIESCVSARVYAPSFSKRIFWLSAIVAAYAVSLPYAYFTAGEPREQAIVRAQELEDEKWATELNETFASIEEETTASFITADNVTLIDSELAGDKEYLPLKKEEELEMTEEEFDELLANTPPISSGWFSSWSLTEDQKKLKRYVRFDL